MLDKGLLASGGKMLDYHSSFGVICNKENKVFFMNGLDGFKGVRQGEVCLLGFHFLDGC